MDQFAGLSLEAWVIIAVALAFDFVNGFHDAANSIATAVATRVLSPRYAVAWAAFWNFVAFLVFSTAVAETIGTGTINIQEVASLEVILAALIGAIFFDLLTWYYGLPASSSHALVGGLAGAAIAAEGFDALVYSGIWKIVAFIFISPLLGMLFGVILMNVVMFVTQGLMSRGWATLRGANWAFRKLQLVSAAAYSLGHGANDAQKTMGIIAAVILIDQSAPVADFEVSLPIVLSAHTAIALGTLMGGWRIVHTLGSKITKLHPIGGFSAESGAAITLFGTAALGIPVSTTHTITGAVVGVGATNRFSAVRWGLTGRVVWAWVLTIPCAAATAALAYGALELVGPEIFIPLGIVGAASWLTLFLRHKRKQVQEPVFAPP
ncbi:MAG: inorganic phosphate transporter [Actinomycetota bacterium]